MVKLEDWKRAIDKGDLSCLETLIESSKELTYSRLCRSDLRAAFFEANAEECSPIHYAGKRGATTVTVALLEAFDTQQLLEFELDSGSDARSLLKLFIDHQNGTAMMHWLRKLQRATIADAQQTDRVRQLVNKKDKINLLAAQRATPLFVLLSLRAKPTEAWHDRFVEFVARLVDLGAETVNDDGKTALEVFEQRVGAGVVGGVLAAQVRRVLERAASPRPAVPAAPAVPATPSHPVLRSAYRPPSALDTLVRSTGDDLQTELANKSYLRALKLLKLSHIDPLVIGDQWAPEALRTLLANCSLADLKRPTFKAALEKIVKLVETDAARRDESILAGRPSALFLAIKTGDVEIMRSLLDASHNKQCLSLTDDENSPWLWLCVECWSKDVFLFLLNYSADNGLVLNEDGQSVLFQNLALPTIDKLALLNGVNCQSESDLDEQLSDCFETLCGLLPSGRVRVLDKPNAAGDWPLLLAVQRGHCRLAAKMINFGANLLQTDFKNRSPMFEMFAFILKSSSSASRQQLMCDLLMQSLDSFAQNLLESCRSEVGNLQWSVDEWRRSAMLYLVTDVRDADGFSILDLAFKHRVLCVLQTVLNWPELFVVRQRPSKASGQNDHDSWAANSVAYDITHISPFARPLGRPKLRYLECVAEEPDLNRLQQLLSVPVVERSVVTAYQSLSADALITFVAHVVVMLLLTHYAFAPAVLHKYSPFAPGYNLTHCVLNGTTWLLVDPSGNSDQPFCEISVPVCLFFFTAFVYMLLDLIPIMISLGAAIARWGKTARQRGRGHLFDQVLFRLHWDRISSWVGQLVFSESIWGIVDGWLSHVMRLAFPCCLFGLAKAAVCSCSYQETYYMSSALLLGWFRTIYVTHGFYDLRRFLIVLQKIIIAVWKFFFVFSIFFFSFAAGMHVLLAANCTDEQEMCAYRFLETCFQLFLLATGVAEPHYGFKQFSPLLKSITVVFMALLTLILFNMLIATMNEIFDQLVTNARLAHALWLLDQAKFVLAFDSFPVTMERVLRCLGNRFMSVRKLPNASLLIEQKRGPYRASAASACDSSPPTCDVLSIGEVTDGLLPMNGLATTLKPLSAYRRCYCFGLADVVPDAAPSSDDLARQMDDVRQQLQDYKTLLRRMCSTTSAADGDALDAGRPLLHSRDTSELFEGRPNRGRPLLESRDVSEVFEAQRPGARLRKDFYVDSISA